MARRDVARSSVARRRSALDRAARAPARSARPCSTCVAYVNLLREKIRVLEAEEKRAEAFNKPHSKRFVPWAMPALPTSQSEVEAPADSDGAFELHGPTGAGGPITALT